MRSTDDTEAKTRSTSRRTFFAAFRNRNFRLLWVALVCTMSIQRMDIVVLGWLTLEMTHSSFLVGLIIAVRRFGAILGPWAGLAPQLGSGHCWALFC